MSEVEQDVAADAFRGVEPLRRGPVTVTGHNDDENELTPEAQRKREQREREKEAGVEVFELKLGPAERLMLLEGRVRRGSKGVPYTATEYLLTLLRNDNRLLEKQVGKLDGRTCKNCQKQLPRGCGGTWAGESRCLLARSEIALEL
ncbi:hypothetical protein [Pseudomonas costantinii]|uniref:Uncharacterized protein n=1 Tax=Pseudomonas costantinii TaxID=168469 RepID=A0A1H4U3J2_9PSED|nr:hypothetical protein [Pseudomonas costantinii]SEC63289.1 hypothetical protein SAMN04515675_0049 [Pseudomonas costantinii]